MLEGRPIRICIMTGTHKPSHITSRLQRNYETVWRRIGQVLIRRWHFPCLSPAMPALLLRNVFSFIPATSPCPTDTGYSFYMEAISRPHKGRLIQDDEATLGFMNAGAFLSLASSVQSWMEGPCCCIPLGTGKLLVPSCVWLGLGLGLCFAHALGLCVATLR